MTNEDLKERFKELLAYNQPLTEITTLFEQALDCPELNIEEEADDYRLAKIIWHAILLEMAEQCILYTKGSRGQASKLQDHYRRKAGRVK